MSRRNLSGFGLAFAVGCALAACGSGEEAVVPVGAHLSAEPSSVRANRPPVIQRIRLDPAEPVRGDLIRAVVVAQDPDGDAIEIGYRWFVNGERVSVDGPEIALGKLGAGSEVELVSVASDGNAESAEARARVVVVDRPPVIVGLTVLPAEKVPPGELVVATAKARDPDGDNVEVHYEWFVNGDRANTQGREFSTDGLRMDDEIQVRVEAVAQGARSDVVESSPVRVGSAPPEIVSKPPERLDGGVFRYDVEAVDPDGDRRFRFRLDVSPEGMTVDLIGGRIEWNPTFEQVGEHQVAVVVRDSGGLEAKQSFHVNVTAVIPASPAAAAD